MKSMNIGVAFLGILGLVGACGSSGPAVSTAAGCATPAASGCKVFVDDPGSFVRWAGPVTDVAVGGASSAVVKHVAGTFCMSGVADPGPSGAGWGALLHLGLIDVAEGGGVSKVTAAFDAPALGVEQLRFTVDSLPPSGLLPQVTQIQSPDCTKIPDCVLTFSLATHLTGPGKLTVPLTAFTQADADHGNASFDQTLLTGLQFYVPSSPGMATPYNFCLRDLAFLDATDNEVTP